jgi:hypothetical protein
MVRHKTALEPLSRDKLFLSVYESCKHRSSGLADAAGVTKIILSEVVPGATEGVVSRDEIVRTAHKVLKRLDPAAATFYVAYHRLPPVSRS